MLKVQGKRYPYEQPWVNRLCDLVKGNRELRERFGIRRMDEFKRFVRAQPLGLMRRSIRALEAGRTSSQLLEEWERLNAPRTSKEEAPAEVRRPSLKVPQPVQLRLLPFWAGVREFR